MPYLIVPFCSTLTLLVLGVRANDHDFAMAPDDFAVLANRLDARSDFHFSLLLNSDNGR